MAIFTRQTQPRGAQDIVFFCFMVLSQPFIGSVFVFKIRLSVFKFSQLPHIASQHVSSHRVCGLGVAGSSVAVKKMLKSLTPFYSELPGASSHFGSPTPQAMLPEALNIESY